jgi:hypothetical protein
MELFSVGGVGGGLPAGRDDHRRGIRLIAAAFHVAYFETVALSDAAV